MTTPLNVSAACCTRVPTRVTGAMKPESGMEMNSTGMPAAAQSTTFCDVISLHFSGAVGQQEKIVSGLARSSCSLPRTASCMSRITWKDSMVKAPVTTGFSP